MAIFQSTTRFQDSSDGFDLVVVLGEQVSQLDLERGRQHLVVGGPLFWVENERLGDLVALPIGSDHVVLLEVLKHKGANISTGTEGSVVAGGIDTGTVQRSTQRFHVRVSDEEGVQHVAAIKHTLFDERVEGNGFLKASGSDVLAVLQLELRLYTAGDGEVAVLGQLAQGRRFGRCRVQ